MGASVSSIVHKRPTADYLLMLLAFAFFGLSILFDGLQGRVALSNHHYFEDGTKLMGVVGWSVYLTRTAMQQLLAIVRSGRF
jgi:hypothetical protein